MSKHGDIYLGEPGSEKLISPFGRTYKERDVELSREQVTASGRTIKEIIAVKKEFELSYEMITGDSLAELIDIYDLQKELSLIVFGETETTTDEGDGYTVIMQPIEKDRISVIDDGLWGGVVVRLRQV
jgi:hypothetical protein